LRVSITWSEFGNVLLTWIRAPIIGEQLADLCHQMTLRGREDGSEIEYHFQIEVFG
jgi:hypothetical protein